MSSCSNCHGTQDCKHPDWVCCPSLLLPAATEVSFTNFTVVWRALRLGPSFRCHGSGDVDAFHNMKTIRPRMWSQRDRPPVKRHWSPTRCPSFGDQQVPSRFGKDLQILARIVKLWQGQGSAWLATALRATRGIISCMLRTGNLTQRLAQGAAKAGELASPWSGAVRHNQLDCIVLGNSQSGHDHRQCSPRSGGWLHSSYCAHESVSVMIWNGYHTWLQFRYLILLGLSWWWCLSNYKPLIGCDLVLK